MEYKALDKFNELQRAYNKLKKISTDNGNTIALSDPYDEVDNFFFHIYSLKEWIKKDSTLNYNTQSEVESYINSHKELALAIDYHNSRKHAGLSIEPRSGGKLEKMNTHIKMDITPRGFVTSACMSLVIGGTEYDAFELATRCMELWRSFLFN